MRDSAGDLPLFGQQAWTGILLTGRWAFSDDETRATTIGLEHGDPDDEATPWLNVLSTRDPADHPVRDLLRDSSSTAPTDRGTAPAHRRGASTATAERRVDIVVDGQPRVFRLWDADDRWYAASEAGDRHAIVIAARHVDPDVTLVPIRDIEPYLAGRREWIRARRQSG
ncbi:MULTISPECIES: hypothetical protein [Prauserella salsuginis group]|uniref:Uncharacterized protein n=1 Tax=Prauserella salsuginis TaxID=387889 RepID=A0ABW6GB54_9PSEU|nr:MULTISPECIES: hypothetical protein [Prauserella salsuginis group]